MYLPKPSKLQTEKEEQGGYFYKHNTIRVGVSHPMERKTRDIATCMNLYTHFIELIIDLFQEIYVRRTFYKNLTNEISNTNNICTIQS